jgi:prepilin-type N-terminal cleavage/methylation domain-containing protein
MLKKNGHSLVEILVVVVVIGTIAALAWPNYKAIKEKTLNREAKASLSLIRAAEKIYRLEQGIYYPYPASTIVSNAAEINSYLKLSLPESGSINWTVRVNSALAAESATATRVGVDSRVWTIYFAGDSNPTCGSGTYCSP